MNIWFTLQYDAENRLVSLIGAVTASFVGVYPERSRRDADGKQVKSTVSGTTTYYVGQHYQKKGTTVTKYYFAGATRLAVRTGGTLSYLLGDHLGSSSVTTNASGVKTASALYKAFGETRYSSGALGTDYKFTGQREQAELGLYFYGARWFDPSLGRFTSPDTIVPTGTQGTQAWDRYAYVNNNPVRYNDPTGHCVFCILFPFVLSAIGATPDYVGIATTMAFTDTDDAVTAAGLAVQSQYPWAIVGGSGKGFAQASNEEIKDGQNPYSPSDAVAIMENRINTVVDACTLCKTPTDRLIVAALAQNYPGFNKNTVTYLPFKDGQINWSKVMTSEQFNNPSAMDAKIRQQITGMNYETQLMLKIYMQDLKVLMQLGYQLPDEYTGADFDYINNLTTNPQTAGQQTPQ